MASPGSFFNDQQGGVNMNHQPTGITSQDINMNHTVDGRNPAPAW